MRSQVDEQSSNPNKYRPNLSSFHQQQLPACTPIITVKNTYPFCLVIGIIFVALGAWFLVISKNLEEVVISYTDCVDNQGNDCQEKVKYPEFYTNFSTCTCSKTFTLQKDMAGPLYFYYGLTNFYQNHRRYVRSRDDNQLNGQEGAPSSDCAPYQYAEINNISYPIAPCGAVAMSIFNDTFSLKLNGSTVPWSRTNIAWPSDRETKFHTVTAQTLAGSVKPPSWPLGPLQRNPNSYSGDEDFIVWMRTAALPTFRKLYAHIDSTAGLKAGTYEFAIEYAYPVTQFDGTKRIIISQISWMGGKNDAMGIAYIVVGIIQILIGIFFLIIDIHLIKRRKTRSQR